MRYFSLVAADGSDSERTCAMIAAPDLSSASRMAQELRATGQLGYVRKGSRFSVRQSSRSETRMLQRFMASCNMAEQATYTEVDRDGLIRRRQTLLESFFVALYLAPEKLRRRLEEHRPEEAPPKPAGGGTQQAPVAPLAAPVAAPVTTPSQATPAEPPPAASPGLLDNSSQEAALAAILSGTASPSGRDGEVDLGDDLF